MLDWAAIARRDAERQQSVRALMRAGEIESGHEYRSAALVFQHSNDPQTLALAHVLASTAAFKGDHSAHWLAAATFDRLMRALDQPQVFGTQFFKAAAESEWTMAPYNREAVNDGLRAAWCVVPLAEQERILGSARAGGPLEGTSLPECP